MQTMDNLHLVQTSHVTHASVAAVTHQMLAIVNTEDAENSITRCQAVAAANYHLNSGGQHIRGRLALHAGSCLGLSPNNCQTLAATCELLHNASLVHDDLHDRDTERRGQPSVWYKFGDEVAVCAGDLLLSAAYRALSQFGLTACLPGLFSLTHSRVANAIRGQCAELHPQRSVTNFDDYRMIVLAKSGALLSLPTELALLAAGHSYALGQARETAESFSIGYQIYDDLLDAQKDATRNVSQHQNHNGLSSACNILLILQSDPACANARQAALTTGLQQCLLAASSSASLPSDSGGALHTMAMQLHEKLFDPK